MKQKNIKMLSARRVWPIYLGIFTIAAIFGMTKPIFSQPPVEVPPSFLVRAMICDRPDMMMRNWYHHEMDKAKDQWQAKYDRLTEISDIIDYQKDHLDFFLRQLDLPNKRTPLNPQITGRITRPEFQVEKIVFESQPKFPVSAALFLPSQSKFKAPYPAVVLACGHSDNGKASLSYQRIAILGAMNGLAVLSVDPIDQGDRLEHLDSTGKPYAMTVKGHNMAAIGGIPIGRSTATIMMWDLMRAIDYLQTRPDIIHNQIGVFGNSGGGTQSAYLMALDSRIMAAAPACYVSSIAGKTIRTIGPPDDEQLIFGQVGFGLDHPDYCIIRAPKPTLLCTATKDFFNIGDSWETFRLAKRIYGRFGLGERMDLVETDEFHGYTKELREAGVRWMLRWLANRDETVIEDETIPVFTDDELRCVPAPGVFALPNVRTVYDLHRQRALELTDLRHNSLKNKTTEEAAVLVRKTANFRSLAEIPLPKIRSEAPTRSTAALECEPGIYLPLRSRWKDLEGAITIVLDDQGRFSDFVTETFKKNKGDILAVDLRGWGETLGKGGRNTASEWFGIDRNEFYFAFMLGKTYVGMRTEDLFSVIRYCQSKGKTEFRLITRGSAETIALHAAVCEPGLIKEIQAVDPLPDWNEQVKNAPCPIQLTDYVYGALKNYDKSDLRKLVNIKQIQTSQSKTASNNLKPNNSKPSK